MDQQTVNRKQAEVFAAAWKRFSHVAWEGHRTTPNIKEVIYVCDVAVPCGFAGPWWKVCLRGSVPLGTKNMLA